MSPLLRASFRRSVGTHFGDEAVAVTRSLAKPECILGNEEGHLQHVTRRRSAQIEPTSLHSASWREWHPHHRATPRSIRAKPRFEGTPIDQGDRFCAKVVPLSRKDRVVAWASRPAHGGWDHRELRTMHFKELRGLFTRNISTQHPLKNDGVRSGQAMTRSLASYMHARERANAMFRLWPDNQPH